LPTLELPISKSLILSGVEDDDSDAAAIENFELGIEQLVCGGVGALVVTQRNVYLPVNGLYGITPNAQLNS